MSNSQDVLRSLMGPNIVDAVSTVSGTQATIPASIRRTLDIEDGDRLKWYLDDSDELRIEVVSRDTGTFADFDGYGGIETDATAEHDGWGRE